MIPKKHIFILFLIILVQVIVVFNFSTIFRVSGSVYRETELKSDASEDNNVGFVLIMLSPASVVCLPFSLLLLYDLRRKKIPDAIPVKIPLIPQQREEEILLISRVTPKTQPLWIFGIIIFLSPLLLFLSPSYMSWIYVRVLFLGASIGFIGLAFFNYVWVRELNIFERNVWMTVFLALLGILICLFLIPGNPFE
ncbi:MAG: hypothetical protein ACFFBD_14615, partial [Candidatus Hodarchaeota archaeon]